MGRTRDGRTARRGSDGVTLPLVATQPVELHVISDATGETAVRLVQALEAQFPDQEFEEIRHPRVETVDDLQLALNRAKGRPAVIVYTLVHPELREAMRALCRRYRLHYCDLLGHPIDAVARVAGVTAQMTPGRAAAARLDLLQAHRGDRVRGQVRRRRRRRPARGGHRPRRRLAHVEDAALDVPRLPRLQDRERPDREGDRAAARALRGRPGEGRRPDDRRERLQEIRRQRAARLGGEPARLRGAGRDLRGARAGRGDPPAAGLPRDRDLRAVDRGDGARVIRLVERRHAEAGSKEEAPVS